MKNNTQNSRIGKVWSKTEQTISFLQKLDKEFKSILYANFENHTRINKKA